MNWLGRSLFESPDVRQICSHMTVAERRGWLWRNVASGLSWALAVGVTAMFGCILMTDAFYASHGDVRSLVQSGFIFSAAVLAVHAVGMAFWRRKHQAQG